MNEMHFFGTILTADFHPGEAGTKSFIQLRVQIDVTEECMVEVYGSVAELNNKFGLISSPADGSAVSLTGRHCKILRNAQGYQLLSII